MENLFFLPETKVTPNSVDILLVTGDAYIDHPSFGIAIIARVLENAGYTVAIWSQPDYRNAALLKLLPEVRLFVGITAGNIDSIVSNYTGRRLFNRRKSVFSPGTSKTTGSGYYCLYFFSKAALQENSYCTRRD